MYLNVYKSHKKYYKVKNFFFFLDYVNEVSIEIHSVFS